MKEEITELEQEDIITNNNLLLYFSGHNNDLLVPKTMESCILKTKQTNKSKPKQKIKPKQNRTKNKTKNEQRRCFLASHADVLRVTKP